MRKLKPTDTETLIAELDELIASTKRMIAHGLAPREQHCGPIPVTQKEREDAIKFVAIYREIGRDRHTLEALKRMVKRGDYREVLTLGKMYQHGVIDGGFNGQAE